MLSFLIKVFRSYRLFVAEIWSLMALHGSFLIITWKLMKSQALFFQDCSFICQSISRWKCLFISWILLKILGLSLAPNCLILIHMHNTLLGLVKMIKNALFWLISILIFIYRGDICVPAFKNPNKQPNIGPRSAFFCLFIIYGLYFTRFSSWIGARS